MFRKLKLFLGLKKKYVCRLLSLHARSREVVEAVQLRSHLQLEVLVDVLLGLLDVFFPLLGSLGELGQVLVKVLHAVHYGLLCLLLLIFDKL